MSDARRIPPGDPALAEALELIRAAFREHEGVIAPPSSVRGMTLADLADPAREVWGIGAPLLAAVVLEPREGHLYAGRLAVAAHARRQGHARALLRLAEGRARALGLPVVALGCRVELTGNHALFLSEGFAETHRTAHEGYDRPTTAWFEKAVGSDDDARHAAKMAKKKAARDRIMATKTEERGLLIVHTGKGKGKSTAAFGMIFRCIAHGMPCAVVQFIKGAMATGERDLIGRHFAHLCQFRTMGEGFTWETQDRARDVAAARAAWEVAKGLIRDPARRMVLLDEINVAIRYDYLDVDEVLGFLRDGRPAGTHVVLTGRNAHESVLEAADLATEMELLKHPFRGGVKAQRGVEF